MAYFVTHMENVTDAYNALYFIGIVSMTESEFLFCNSQRLVK